MPYYLSGDINIPNVNNDVTIVASAIDSAPINSIRLSIDDPSAVSPQPYNGGIGWEHGYRIRSSQNSGEYGQAVSGANSEITGFVPYKGGDDLYIANINLLTAADGSYPVFGFYDSVGNPIYVFAISNASGIVGSSMLSGYFTNYDFYTNTGYYGNYCKVRLKSGGSGALVEYFRMSSSNITNKSAMYVNSYPPDAPFVS